MEFTTIVFIVVIVLLIATIGKIGTDKGVLEKSLEALKKTLEAAEATIANLEPLKKYQSIQDADREAQRILKDANEQSNQTINSALEKSEKIQTDAIEISDNLRAESRANARATREKNEALLNTAQEQHDKIIDTARQQAIEIAGDALKAKENTDLYSKTAAAMKNAIKGYGDEYLIPNHTLIDELAEDFGHKEGGQKLKDARAHSRTLIKNEMAAECDYKEPNRRTDAIHFVLDAFNGKVDTALAKAKHDNFGKLQQEIEDGSNLVNRTGQAFRNARVTPIYLSARLDELRWAVTTNELKRLEREEQRVIREAMREEERARREYEKAQKEAAKEESMLQKAMETARKQLAGANEEQRQQYEQQLADLELKLHEAEEKNQRALSMAQQTRQGHVYVISNIGSFGENIFKIGMTRRLEPMDRVKELGDASVPFGFDVHAMIHSDNAPQLEKALHERFNGERVNRINLRKEFFNVSIIDIRHIIQSMDIDVHWTMRAEALEYRESLVEKNRPPKVNLTVQPVVNEQLATA